MLYINIDFARAWPVRVPVYRAGTGRHTQSSGNDIRKSENDRENGNDFICSFLLAAISTEGLF